MNTSLYYIKKPSSLKENAPLLIMCHGYGSDENDLFSFAPELPEELFIISLRAPYAMQPYGNAWYAINFDAEKGKWSDNIQAKQSVELISDFIDYACQTYAVNKDNVTLLGFSQGTILSLAVAMNYPQKLKNVIALSGYLNEAILPEHIEKKRVSHLNVFCSHGYADQVIPVEWARKTPEVLKALGMNYTYKEYPVGHGVAPQNFYDFRDWLKDYV
ncbi:alpha/beta hydrolase [Winogradskyella aquimaris]|uniref:Alpha/beta fold hydrolase n=1 Tax=Winogradskyella aquimaris TaxID=864074 RepID=A0ABU5EJY6_9FLAO|nr:alpha/beta fold hydrolase [Winogradskyella aquimaris]MDY2586686.1 alpha/beta fold hydrolase [Winogradskyella aquimaris]